jgi:ABC-2 type transport system ATP-binding protein
MHASSTPSASGSPAIRIDGLQKHYGSVAAVRGIDLEVNQGEVFGFLGPNGAGKSTTIRCLLGLLRPTSGRVTAFGLDTWSRGVAARRRMAYLPGELRLPERLTTLDLATAVGRLRGSLDAQWRDELAERLQLDMSRPLRDLSSGNRRKVALLLAFVANADLLVLDEPTNGLDPLIQHEFLALVREARDRGATVFLSSHVLSEVQRVADRVAVLREGTVIAAGTVTELRGRARQHLEAWFEGEPPTEALRALPGVAEALVDGRRFAATLHGPVQPVLDLLARYPVASLLVEDPDLDDAFMDLYANADEAAAVAATTVAASTVTPAGPAGPAA